MNKEKREFLDRLLKYASENHVDLPDDIQIALKVLIQKEQVELIRKEQRPFPEIPIFGLMQSGLVPAPMQRGLTLMSDGWIRVAEIPVAGGGGGGTRLPKSSLGWLHNDGNGGLIWSTPPGGGGGVTDHALLSNLSFAASGHTGFQQYALILATLAALANGVGWLHNDGAGGLAWSVPAGGGDVFGPAGATDGNFASFNLATGKIIKDSGLSAASFDPAGAAAAITLAALGGQPLDADLTALAAIAASRGMLITAQGAGAVWTGYAISVPAAGLMNVLGTVNGDLEPGYKPIFDTTNPEALGVAGPGTQVIAARRDHKHPNPALDTLASPTDITTLDVSTTAHGLAPKAVAPAAGLQNIYGIANGETAITNKPMFDNTNPAALGSASPGTSLIAARRDHVHDAPADNTLMLVNDQAGTSYTLATTDKNYIVRCANVATITVTVPTNIAQPFPIGSVVTIEKYSSGNVRIVPNGGVTLNSVAGYNTINFQYGVASLIKTATNTWLLTGDLMYT